MIHRNKIPLLLRLLANDTGCPVISVTATKYTFTASDCITAAYVSLEFHSTNRTTKSRSYYASLDHVLERQEIFDGLFLGNPTRDGHATNVNQE